MEILELLLNYSFEVSTDFSIYYTGCRGTEDSLFDCYQYYYRNCTAEEGAGVICEYEAPNTTVELVGGNSTDGNILLDGRPIW